MREKPYYSVRTGKHPGGLNLDLPTLKKQFVSIDRQFADRHYFQEAYGYTCVDAGHVPGALGLDVASSILIAMRKDNLWPIHLRIDEYTEDDVFDMIGFSHDHVSKPLDGHYHDYYQCGWHYSTFDRVQGRAEYRAAINRILPIYGEGYELSEGGEMLALPEDGLSTLIDAPVPALDPDNVDARVKAAIHSFRRYKSPLEDRRHAIRDLVDVLAVRSPSFALSSRDPMNNERLEHRWQRG